MSHNYEVWDLNEPEHRWILKEYYEIDCQAFAFAHIYGPFMKPVRIELYTLRGLLVRTLDFGDSNVEILKYA